MPPAAVSALRLLNTDGSTHDSSRTAAVMDTLVTIHVVSPREQTGDAAPAIERAFEWFHQVERCCSRFDAGSEVTALALRAGAAVPVSPMLLEVVQFALAVAEESHGAFDPTVGWEMERRGFNREYKTGQVVRTAAATGQRVSYRDVQVDGSAGTITLLRPLMLDLGAVAKGLAIDLAARELAPLESYAIDAGGDLYLAGSNPSGRPWTVGIRHPRSPEQLLETLEVANCAVCTSGDYERPASDGGGHIMDPRRGEPATGVASVTVVAPTAMLADALGTAAFVMGPSAGIELLNRHQVAGLILSSSLERFVTTRPLS